MNAEEKNHRRAILQYLKSEERLAFKESLPTSESEIDALFEYLEENLDECDESLDLTSAFIAERSLPKQEIIGWLNENGGFCDCEVLANVEDKWEQMMK